MVRFGQPATDPSAPEKAGIGTITLRELLAEGSHGLPLLLDRHLLMLVTGGHGSSEVDFVTHQCRPGTLIRARPGQMIRYGAQPGLDAVILRWSPTVLAGLAARPVLDGDTGPTHWQLAGEDEDAVINEMSQLVVDCQRHGDAELGAELLRHQLAVLLLRIALLPTPQGRPEPAEEAATFQRFRAEVERTYAQSRRVEEYAERIGCVVRTLTRACLAATGRSAKQLLDDRVALQAMRLLAATDLPVADVGHRLGFPEPTNFGRFFQREVGCSPGAFRAALRRPVRVAVPGQRQPRPADPAVPRVATRPVR
ncbi:AraC family transcriptional regulator [Micromonospora sp. NPDC049679]|uniref:helix-turn-helix transcriptional regulator n=1 Tax=Micromonospora sp. NPDC049679 TaxID=3155920 RepID=UPI0033E910DA